MRSTTDAWSWSPAEAIALQRELASRVRCVDALGPVRTIAGVDVSMARATGDSRMDRFASEGHAAIVVLSVPELAILEVAEASLRLGMPYIPGLLSFRELPIVLAAYERLKTIPDLLMVDGHGIAHPRGLGIAAHLGVTLDVPTIGCAKSILVGRHEPLPPERGARAPLVYRDREIGVALRTKNKVNPLFISCGHRVSLETAVRWVLECARGYRMPEPTRQAHMAANAVRRRALEGLP